MSFRTRIIIITSLLVLISTLFLSSFYNYLFSLQSQNNLKLISENIYNERENNLKSLCNTAISLAKQYMNRADLTPAEQKKRFLERLSSMRYDEGKGYFWIHEFPNEEDTIPQIVMHPTSPKVVGKNIKEFMDLENLNKIKLEGEIIELDTEIISRMGKKFLVEMNEACKEKGEGFVTYYWTKPLPNGSTTEEGYKKLAFVKLIPEWNWVVGTSLYIDDIEAMNIKFAEDFRRDTINMLIKSAIVFAISMSIFIIVITLFTSIMTRELDVLSKLANKISKGDYPESVPAKSYGEFKAVRIAFNEMINSMRKREKLLIEKADDLNEVNRNLNIALGTRDVLLANVSHEIRTPIVTIIGYCELMLNGLFGEVNNKQKEKLKACIKGGNGLLDIFDELLSIVSTESRIITSKQKVDLREITNEAESMMIPRASRNKISFEIDHYSEPLYISANFSSMIQAIIPIIGNAIKFSKPESKIKITTNRDSEKAFLIVKDWGIGIPKEKLNRVFDKFYKTDDSKTQKYGGLGLGLSIAKKIIEENSGKIEIESEEGLGTTCRIILPLAKEE